MDARRRKTVVAIPEVVPRGRGDSNYLGGGFSALSTGVAGVIGGTSFGLGMPRWRTTAIVVGGLVVALIGLVWLGKKSRDPGAQEQIEYYEQDPQYEQQMTEIPALPTPIQSVPVQGVQTPPPRNLLPQTQPQVAAAGPAEMGGGGMASQLSMYQNSIARMSGMAMPNIPGHNICIPGLPTPNRQATK